MWTHNRLCRIVCQKGGEGGGGGGLAHGGENDGAVSETCKGTHLHTTVTADSLRTPPSHPRTCRIQCFVQRPAHIMFAPQHTQSAHTLFNLHHTQTSTSQLTHPLTCTPPVPPCSCPSTPPCSCPRPRAGSSQGRRDQQRLSTGSCQGTLQCSAGCGGVCRGGRGGRGSRPKDGG